MNRPWILIATFFNIGYFPIAPGTLTSLVTTMIFYGVNSHVNPPYYIHLISIAIIIIVAIAAASAAEKYFHEKDPRQVVIDEVAGQMIALLLLPLSIKLYLAGFFLFRFFDILKPFPIRRIDRKVPGGLGIVLDDLLAGLYSLATLQLFVHIWPKIF